MNSEIKKSNARQVLKNSTILMFVVTIVIAVMAFAISGIRGEVSKLTAYMEATSEIRPNFEKSLDLYARGTKDEIDYLLSLRPENEQEYVRFISGVETIAQNMKLNFEMRSEINQNPRNPASKTFIAYRIYFRGDYLQLIQFLEEMETIPFMTAVDQIKFRDLKFIDEGEEDVMNVEILVKLFIK